MVILVYSYIKYIYIASFHIYSQTLAIRFRSVKEELLFFLLRLCKSFCRHGTSLPYLPLIVFGQKNPYRYSTTKLTPHSVNSKIKFN